ncbi:MAG: hypothetical protein MPN21_26220 [Thermoanaerobaculia bacterium]|nr:hypothetical protein [Thermoanaerobaculia bacterium]
MWQAITVTLVAALLVQAVRLAVGFQLTDGIPLDPILRHDVLGILGFASAAVISGTVGLLMLFSQRDSLVRIAGWIMAVVAAFQMSASHLAIMSGRSMQAVLQPAFLAAHLPSVALSVSFAVSIDFAIVLLARLYQFVEKPEPASETASLEREVQIALDRAREAQGQEPRSASLRSAVSMASRSPAPPTSPSQTHELTCPECGEWSTGQRESRVLAVRALNGHRTHCVVRRLGTRKVNPR